MTKNVLERGWRLSIGERVAKSLSLHPQPGSISERANAKDFSHSTLGPYLLDAKKIHEELTITRNNKLHNADKPDALDLSPEQSAQMIKLGQERLRRLKESPTHTTGDKFTREEIITHHVEILTGLSEIYCGIKGQQPRESQELAILAVIDYLKNPGNLKGRMIDMPTAAGKSLVIAITAVLRGLEVENGERRLVHVWERNTELARRDVMALGNLAEAVNLTVALIRPDSTQANFVDGELKEITDQTEKLHLQLDEEIPPSEQLKIAARKRNEAYKADIVIGEYTQFGHDYERSEATLERGQITYPIDELKNGRITVIPDEVDEIIGFEARTPLAISDAPEDRIELTIGNRSYSEIQLNEIFAEIVNALREDVDYEVEMRGKYKSVKLISEEGQQTAGLDKVEAELRERGILTKDEGVYTSQRETARVLNRHLFNALSAKALFKPNKDYDVRKKIINGPNGNQFYVVRNGRLLHEVALLHEEMNRSLPGRRLSQGLHGALEARAKVENPLLEIQLNADAETIDQIAQYDFVRMHAEIFGFSGTSLPYANLFRQLYDCDTVIIPTELKTARIDYNSSNKTEIIFKNTDEKLDGIVEQIIEDYEIQFANQRAKAKKSGETPSFIAEPIMIDLRDTNAIYELARKLRIMLESDEIQKKIAKKILPANLKALLTISILTDLNSLNEAREIANAGKQNSILITNIVDRGTDPQLGGSAPENPQERIAWEKALQELINGFGGHLLLAEHRSTAADLQLLARLGRKGTPAETFFVSSLEDAFLVEGFGNKDYLKRRVDKSKHTSKDGKHKVYVGPRARVDVEIALKNIDRQRTAQTETYVKHYEIYREFRERVTNARELIRNASDEDFETALVNELASRVSHFSLDDLPIFLQETAIKLRDAKTTTQRSLLAAELKDVIKKRLNSMPRDQARENFFILIGRAWSSYIDGLVEIEMNAQDSDQSYIPYTSSRKEENIYKQQAAEAYEAMLDGIDLSFLRFIG